MTHPQVSRVARRARQKEQLRCAAARGVPPEDPELRRMLTSHIHCGQKMQLVTMTPVLPGEQTEAKNDDGLLTYRCACGFSFDQRPDDWP